MARHSPRCIHFPYSGHAGNPWVSYMVHRVARGTDTALRNKSCLHRSTLGIRKTSHRVLLSSGLDCTDLHRRHLRDLTLRKTCPADTKLVHRCWPSGRYSISYCVAASCFVHLAQHISYISPQRSSPCRRRVPDRLRRLGGSFWNRRHRAHKPLPRPRS